MSFRIVSGAIFKNFKNIDTNNLHVYRVFDVAKHTETSESLVVYQKILNYRDDKLSSQLVLGHEFFAKPYHIFSGTVNTGEKIIPRYKFVKYSL